METKGEGWNKGNMSIQRVDTMKIMDQEYHKVDSLYQVRQDCWKRKEGSHYSYMDDGYDDWNPYKQEIRKHGGG